jgi:predicted O-methyltransferase YrrM
METLKINYFNHASELCEIGRKYDTDKSSQRNNVTDIRHCHPYTLFYEGLFRNKKNAKLKIAELGVLHGSSLRMWQEYFPNSEIYGFDYHDDILERFRQSYDNSRIKLANMDVRYTDKIKKAYAGFHVCYDIIVEDTTHQFEDQLRVIENSYEYLKPGGILILENIFKSYHENYYITRLKDTLTHFQEYYFVELDHCRRNSTGWNNDKLFVLVKGGAEPIFKNTNKVTIITPSYRTQNLPKLKDSIRFDFVEEWIIVYDGSRITENPNVFKDQEHDQENAHKIKEYVHTSEGLSGNPQRNFALTKITNPNTTLYYLDDDNIVHPNLYTLLNIIDNTKLYTFNRENGIKGDNIGAHCIDTAMFMVPWQMCRNVKWIIDKYEADGHYIKDCKTLANENVHIYVDNAMCYYNKVV